MRKEVYVYKYDGDTEYVTSDRQALLDYLKENYYYSASMSTLIRDIERELKDHGSGAHEIKVVYL